MGLKATLTTRTITCLVGNPSKPSSLNLHLPLLLGKERPNSLDNPSGCHISVFFCYKFSPLNYLHLPVGPTFLETKATQITKRALERYISGMIWNIECAEFWFRFVPMFSLLRRGHESRNVLQHGLQCFLHERGNCRWALARDTWIFGRGRWGEWLLMLRWTRFQLLVLGMFSCSQPFFFGRNHVFYPWEKQPTHRTPPTKWAFPNHFQESWKNCSKCCAQHSETPEGEWSLNVTIMGISPKWQPSQAIGPYGGVIHHHCPWMIPQ